MFKTAKVEKEPIFFSAPLPAPAFRPGILGFILASLLLSYIQFSNWNLPDHDGHYHIRMAEQIRKQGLPTPFPYLPLTLLDEKRFTDHHMLFHLLQSPFTWIPDLRLAAKISAVFMAAAALAIFVWFLARHRVPYPLLWLLLLFASSPAFLFRMSMARAQSLSLLLQLVGAHFLLQRNYRVLFIVSVLFVWSYNAFPTLAALAGIGFLVFYFSEKRLEWKIPLSVWGGIMVGLLFNPYFPENILFLYNHIIPKILVARYETRVGSEWYPYNTWVLLQTAGIALMAYFAGIFLTDPKHWRKDPQQLFWFLTATLYCILLLKSRRFVEYFPPMAILFLAFALGNSLRAILSSRKLLLATFIVLCTVAGYSIPAARKQVQESNLTERYRGGALWLQKNTPEGSRVFHTDWDDFPVLFFYNTHNRYIAGLDADFLRLENPELYRKYQQITAGKEKDPATAVSTQFGAEFIFTEKNHKSFVKAADKAPGLKKVFSDKYCIIYRIIPANKPLYLPS